MLFWGLKIKTAGNDPGKGIGSQKGIIKFSSQERRDEKKSIEPSEEEKSADLENRDKTQKCLSEGGWSRVNWATKEAVH